uniref:Uncharacterized protein n=1 Tax=Anguilla anguilla TaxID=7936 RepID=A0A0E9VIY7_ANGAN
MILWFYFLLNVLLSWSLFLGCRSPHQPLCNVAC